MKLSDQAIGALMMALQKSLMEQSDIVPVLKEMDFHVIPNDEGDFREGDSTLVVTNPPVVSFEGISLEETTNTPREESTDAN
jgi:hypothetical protein